MPAPETGSWHYIPSIDAVGRIAQSDTPLFDEEGFITVFVPEDGKQHSFTVDQLTPIDMMDFRDGEPVGSLQHFCSYFLHNHPQKVYDKEYEQWFDLKEGDVAIIIDSSPFHTTIQFGPICERECRNFNTNEPYIEYFTEGQLNEDETPFLNGADHNDYWAKADPEFFTGGIVIVNNFSAQLTAGVKKRPQETIPMSDGLETVSWCQECGYFYEDERLYYDDVCSLVALRGQEQKCRCEGCHEDQDSVSLRAYGEYTDECSYIGEHSAYVEEDITNNVINHIDWNTMALELDSPYYDLTDQPDWALEGYIDDLIEVVQKHGNDTFTLIVIGEDKVLINRDEIFPFAAWLIKRERKQDLIGFRAAGVLSNLMPTKEQIVAYYRDGAMPDLMPSGVPENYDPAEVTIGTLRRMGACAPQRKAFCELFSGGCKMSLNEIKLAEERLNLGWFVDTWKTQVSYSSEEYLNLSNAVNDTAERFFIMWWEQFPDRLEDMIATLPEDTQIAYKAYKEREV